MLINLFDRPIWIVTPGRFALEMGLAFGIGVACQVYYSIRLRSVGPMLLRQKSVPASGKLKLDESVIERMRRLVFIDACVIAPALEEALCRGPAIFVLRYSLLLAFVLGIGLNVLFAIGHRREFENRTTRRYIRRQIFVFGVHVLVLGLLTGSLFVPLILHGILNARDYEFLPWQKWSPKDHPVIIFTKFRIGFSHIEFRQKNDIHDE